jgi:hypothetical protein
MPPARNSKFWFYDYPYPGDLSARASPPVKSMPFDGAKDSCRSDMIGFDVSACRRALNGRFAAGHFKVSHRRFGAEVMNLFANENLPGFLRSQVQQRVGIFDDLVNATAQKLGSLL